MQQLSKTERVLAAFYFLWCILHLCFFFYSQETADSHQFWPFISSPKGLEGTYDISEFLSYVGVPLILFIAYRIVFVKHDADSVYGGKSHHIGSFFIAFLDEKIRTEELTQKINALTQQPVSEDKLNELKSDREKAASQGVNHWYDRMEVRKKYKDFEY